MRGVAAELTNYEEFDVNWLENQPLRADLANAKKQESTLVEGVERQTETTALSAEQQAVKAAIGLYLLRGDATRPQRTMTAPG
jgi:hypothetical protein